MFEIQLEKPALELCQWNKGQVELLGLNSSLQLAGGLSQWPAIV